MKTRSSCGEDGSKHLVVKMTSWLTIMCCTSHGVSRTSMLWGTEPCESGMTMVKNCSSTLWRMQLWVNVDTTGLVCMNIGINQSVDNCGDQMSSWWWWCAAMSRPSCVGAHSRCRCTKLVWAVVTGESAELWSCVKLMMDPWDLYGDSVSDKGWPLKMW